MEKNVRWKHPDGAGGFTELNLPSSAEIVAYGAGTVKDELDNLSATTGVSAFMGKLFRANNAVEARSLLKVGREDIFDETGNRWNSLGAVCSPSEKKIGANSLYLNAGYLMNPTGITLGGKDFTIALWAYEIAANTSNGQVFFFWGSTTSFILLWSNRSNALAQLIWEDGVQTAGSKSGTTSALTIGQWHHIELDYRQSDNTVFIFLDGSLVCSFTETTFATARTFPMYLGTNARDLSLRFNGYIDEFFVTETLLHTANFTPPSAPYDMNDDTLALLHFDTFDFFADDSGSYWLNLNAALSSTQKKFGSKSLDASAGYLKKSALTLGGKDFTIALWAYEIAANTSNGQVFFFWGSTTNFILLFSSRANKLAQLIWEDGVQTAGSKSGTTSALTTGQWQHIEVDYRQSDNTVFIFLDGSLVCSFTETTFATARTFPMYLGTNARDVSLRLNGYIDEVLVTETLLHDANFTPPTAPYDLDGNTLALLHFE